MKFLINIKSKSRTTSYVIMVLTMLLTGSVFAQYLESFTDYKKFQGTSALLFLTLPSGARGASLGHASGALISDASSAFWNPAALGLLRKHEFLFSHNEMFLGVRNEYMSVAFPKDYFGTVAFSGKMFSAGTFKNSMDIEENNSDPAFMDISAGLSYGREILRERLYGGLGVHFLQSTREKQTAIGLSADASFLLHVGSFHFSTVVKNAGPDIKYDNTKEILPLGINLGIGQDLARSLKFMWGIGYAQYVGCLPEASIGFEHYVGQYLTLRAGYTIPFDSLMFNGVKGLTIGFGLREKNFLLDYTWEGGDPFLGNKHYLSIAASFKELTPKTADDYYNKALKHFRKGRYKRCIKESENAIMLNPNMWKAHTLIARSKERLRITSGEELSIIYTGNLQGNIASLKDGKTIIGGIARQATVVKQLKANNPYNIVIDAGNLFLAKTESIKVDGVLEAMSYMGYSVIGTGLGEVSNNDNIGLLGMEAKKHNLKFVSTNTAFTKNINGFIEDYYTRINNKYGVYIINFIGKGFVEEKENMHKRYESIINSMTSLIAKNGKKADVKIAIINDKDINVRYLARMVSGLDIIVCGSNSRIYVKPVVVNKTIILSSGKGGKYVGVLDLRFGGDKEILTYNHRLIRLTEKITEDKKVAELVKNMLIKIEEKKENIDFKSGKIKGKFLFTSNRTGKMQIYLKDIKTNTEFRLTDTVYTHYNPKLCNANGKVAYIKEWKDSLTGDLYRDLCTMEMAGVKHRMITNKENVKSFSWFPDGSAIYFCSNKSGDYEIYKTDPEGGVRTNVSNSPNSDETYVTFSFADKEMAYISDKDSKNQIFLTNKEGEQPLRLSEENANYALPKYSPDGKYIAFLCDRYGFDGTRDIVIYNKETGKTEFITQNSNVKSFTWLDDSKYVVFEAGENLFDLNIYDVIEKSMRKLLPVYHMKRYNEKNPQSVWYDNQYWVLFEKDANNKSIINMVKPDGTGEQPCCSEYPDNFLK